MVSIFADSQGASGSLIEPKRSSKETRGDPGELRGVSGEPEDAPSRTSGKLQGAKLKPWGAPGLPRVHTFLLTKHRAIFPNEAVSPVVVAVAYAFSVSVGVAAPPSSNE